MVGFALSCFGLLLFLWLAFGGPIPLKPKGYRFTTSFGEATQLAKEADVRISGVSVGKVKDDRDRHADRAARTRRSSSSAQYAPLPKDTQGDPAPEDAAGRDLRRADAGPQGGGHDPRGRHAAGGAGLADGRARRDLPRVRRRRRARRSRPGCSSQAQSRRRPRAGHQRRARQPRAVRRGHHDAAADPQLAAGATSAGSCATPATVFDALSRARRPAALADHQLQPRLRDDRGARRRARRPSSVAADVREASRTTTRQAPGARSRATPTRSSPSCGPAARELSPTLEQPRGARARPQGAVPRPRPADRRVEGGPAGDAGVPRRAAPAAGRVRPAAAPAQPDPRRSSAPTSPSSPRSSPTRSPRPRRRHRPGSAGTRSTTCARSNPVNPENLAAYPQPHRRRTAPTRTQFPGRRSLSDLLDGRHGPDVRTRRATAATACPTIDRRPGARPGSAACRSSGHGAAPTTSRSSPTATSGGTVAGAAVHASRRRSRLERRRTQYPQLAADPQRRRGPPARGRPERGDADPAARSPRGTVIARWLRRPGSHRRAPARGAPSPCSPSSAARGRRRGARAAPRADGGHRHARRPRHAPSYQATERYHQRFGDDAVIVLVARAAAQARADLGPRARARPRGLPRRATCPKGATPRGGRERAVRAAGARPSRSRSSSGPGRSSTSPSRQIADEFARAAARPAGAGRPGGAARARKLALARGLTPARRPKKLGEQAGAARPARSSLRDVAAARAASTGSRSAADSSTTRSFVVAARLRRRAGRRARRRRASPTCSRRTTAR